MPFARKTLTQLRGEAKADVQAALPGADTLLRYSNLAILADMQAAMANGHYGYLDYIALQSVPFTAAGEYLEGWAALKGVIRKSATAATGQVSFSGVNGTVIPAKTGVSRGDGVAYVTTADTTLTGGSGAAPIQAVITGAAGNAVAGTSFSLSLSIAGVSVGGIAVQAITGGADVEDDDALRGRMLDAFASPPQGGSIADYQQWALAVPGVTRCWPIPGGQGPGTVVLFFMMDNAEAASGGFPQGRNGVAAAETRDSPAAGDQLALANAIYLKQPATPIVYACAPQANSITITIAGIAGASASVKATIAIAIQSALLLSAVPGGTTNVSAIEGAIAAINGSAGFVITGIGCSAGSVTPGAAGNIVSAAGYLPVLAGINYQ